MATTTTMTGAVELKTASVESVAFDLMKLISGYEGDKFTKDRAYWLALYRECYKLAKGDPLPSESTNPPGKVD